jgi:hypothetical protein
MSTPDLPLDTARIRAHGFLAIAALDAELV